MKRGLGSSISVGRQDRGCAWQDYHFAGQRPLLMQWVTEPEVENLRHALAQGRVPLDLESKLMTLRQGDLGKICMEQACRWFIAILMAAEQGMFPQLEPGERERILRVLAYVRKYDDSIPDYQADGYTDDQQEVRAAALDYAGAIQAFKAWHLRNHVPSLWGWRAASGN